jgi:8-oxo-dGTP diphosphatase
VAIYLVRHGHAGDRSDWSGDDLQRPLSAKGRRQADHIRHLLDDEPVKAIFSSPATRCIETVEPLAARLGLAVQEAVELVEGCDPDAAIRFALERAEDNPVLCSHGDVIPQMLRRFVSAGMRGDVGSESRKGSVWVLELDGDDVVRGSYRPPQD